MSDDLVKRLRQSWDVDRSIMSQTDQWMTEREEAADRIEELEAKLAQQDDLVQAAVAAALREAAAAIQSDEMLSPVGAHRVSARILTLITPDAQAALDRVVAAERERNAKVAERMSDEWATEWRKGRKCDTHLEGMSDGADDVAAAIRKGGE